MGTGYRAERRGLLAPNGDKTALLELVAWHTLTA